MMIVYRRHEKQPNDFTSTKIKKKSLRTETDALGNFSSLLRIKNKTISEYSSLVSTPLSLSKIYFT